MPGSILAPNSASFEKKIRKIQVAKWGTPKKLKIILLKKSKQVICNTGTKFVEGQSLAHHVAIFKKVINI